MNNRRIADSLKVAEKARSVAKMERLELESEWRTQFGTPPPRKLRTELMRPVLIYRIQRNAFRLLAPKRKGSITQRPLGQLVYIEVS